MYVNVKYIYIYIYIGRYYSSFKYQIHVKINDTNNKVIRLRKIQSSTWRTHSVRLTVDVKAVKLLTSVPTVTFDPIYKNLSVEFLKSCDSIIDNLY